MKMIMECPKCKKDINVQKQIEELFDYHDGMSEFDPQYGVIFHEIHCDNPECNAFWILTLSGMELREQV